MQRLLSLAFWFTFVTALNCIESRLMVLSLIITFTILHILHWESVPLCCYFWTLLIGLSLLENLKNVYKRTTSLSGQSGNWRHFTIIEPWLSLWSGNIYKQSKDNLLLLAPNIATSIKFTYIFIYLICWISVAALEVVVVWLT